MFCPKCGASIPDGSAFCSSCGASFNSDAKNFGNQARNAFNQAERNMGNEFRNIGNTFTQGGGYGGGPLQTDRNLITYIVLTIITLGIYGYYFIYKMAQDVNVACGGDGQETAGLAAFILLSIVTCGIYSWYWYYKLGNRLADNAPRYGMTFQENGSTILMWLIIGSLICGIGAFIAMNILIKNTNSICAAYNHSHDYSA